MFLNGQEGYILFDHFNNINFQLVRLIFLSVLAKFHNSKIICFNYKLNPFLKKIYDLLQIEIINSRKFVLDNKNTILSHEIFNKIYKRIKNKDDIFNLKIFNLEVGIDIYESYLIKYKKPTLEVSDPEFKIFLFNSIKYLLFVKSVFKNYNIKAVNITHREYVDTNFFCRMAYKKNITVYTFSGEFDRISRYSNSKRDFCKHYRNFYSQLTNHEKTKAIILSKKRLYLRLSGKVGVDMNYSTKSAFVKSNNSHYVKEIKQTSKKIKIVICTHCFYDNPQAYDGNLFKDFYEWIVFLGKLSGKTNYEWFIKPHPDYLPGTIEIIKSIIKEYPKIKLLNPSTSFYALKDMGINFALTVYGSVAHELPLLGINVINADKNSPQSSFKFSYTPKNINDYYNVLKNLGSFKDLIKYKDEIYQFYYIHNFFLKKNIFFKNKKTFYKKYNEQNKIFVKYFVGSMNLKNLKIIERTLYNFFETSYKYLSKNRAQKIVHKFCKI